MIDDPGVKVVQRGASGQQSSGSPAAADPDQEQAKSDLEQAERDLQQMQQEAANRKKQEELFKIETELKAMLDAQRAVNKVVKMVELERGKREGKDLGRIERRRVLQAATEEAKLADRARKATDMLTDAPVFQYALRDAREDMDEVQRRLERESTGEYTQDVGNDVVIKLERLISALKKERRENQQQQQQAGGGGGGGGGNQKPRLVPVLAEIKMIRAMHQAVMDKSKRLDARMRKDRRRIANEDEREQMGRLARKQGDIAEIAKQLGDSIKEGAQK